MGCRVPLSRGSRGTGQDRVSNAGALNHLPPAAPDRIHSLLDPAAGPAPKWPETAGAARQPNPLTAHAGPAKIPTSKHLLLRHAHRHGSTPAAGRARGVPFQARCRQSRWSPPGPAARPAPCAAQRAGTFHTSAPRPAAPLDQCRLRAAGVCRLPGRCAAPALPPAHCHAVGVQAGPDRGRRLPPESPAWAQAERGASQPGPTRHTRPHQVHRPALPPQVLGGVGKGSAGGLAQAVQSATSHPPCSCAVRASGGPFFSHARRRLARTRRWYVSLHNGGAGPADAAGEAGGSPAPPRRLPSAEHIRAAEPSLSDFSALANYTKLDGAQATPAGPAPAPAPSPGLAPALQPAAALAKRASPSQAELQTALIPAAHARPRGK